METEVFRDRVERLVFAIPAFPLPSGRPVPVPEAMPIEAGACYPGTLAVQTFLVPKAFASRVCKSGMGEVEVLYVPGRLGVGGFTVIRTARAFPEKYQFEAVPFAIRRGHITGVIPPFRAKILMLEVISRKLIGITRQGLAVLETTPEQWENNKRKYEQPQMPAYRSILLP